MTYTGLKATFDAVAAGYDAVRPTYPQELIHSILDFSQLPQQGRILEVGCGTGQATLPFAARGYAMLCLEPGHNLAATLAHHVAPFPRIAIEEVTFEDWPVETEAFDLVMAAQSFHWIPAEIGCAKAAQALKPTGSLALFWNLSPDSEGPEHEAWSRIQQVYWECAPEIAHEPGADPLTAQVRTLEAQLRAQHKYFRDVVVQQFPWSLRYDTAQYLQLLNTYSNHLTLPDERRKCLRGGIAEVIEQHGGSVSKNYVSLLLAAHKV